MRCPIFRPIPLVHILQKGEVPTCSFSDVNRKLFLQHVLISWAPWQRVLFCFRLTFKNKACFAVNVFKCQLFIVFKRRHPFSFLQIESFQEVVKCRPRVMLQAELTQSPLYESLSREEKKFCYKFLSLHCKLTKKLYIHKMYLKSWV